MIEFLRKHVALIVQLEDKELEVVASYFLGRGAFTFFSEPLILWLKDQVHLKTDGVPRLHKKL